MICTACKKNKDLELFNFRNKAKGIRHKYCKDCGSEKTKKHYNNNKQYYVEKARRHTKNNIEVVRELKKVPCADCGNDYPYYVMDFDHREGKEFTIAEKVRTRGIEVLKKEIDKCDVVCANCHRERTHQRKTLL